MDECKKEVFTLQIRRQASKSIVSPNCLGCMKGFVLVNSLEVRQFTQTGKLPGVCKACNSAFLRICRMQIRNLTHGSEQPHVCGICNKSFTHAGNFKKHLLSRHGDGSENPSDEKPAQEFIRRKETGEAKPPFTCNVCHKTFVKYGSYVKHCQIHLSICKDCGKPFESRQLLQDHIDNDGTCKEKYICGVCAETFVSKVDLSNHGKTHLEEPTMVVEKEEVISEESNNSENVEEEEIKHNFTCDLCNKGFMRQRTYTTHLLTHEGNLPYECKTCKRGFLYPGMFRKHVMQHQRTRQYHCRYCDKPFASLKTLRKHNLLHKV